MAVTLSEKEKRALKELFVSISEERSIIEKIKLKIKFYLSKMIK